MTWFPASVGATIRVGFNARLLTDPSLRGWNRYTINLLAALPACGVRPVLYTSTAIYPDHLARLPAGSFEVRVGGPASYPLWDQWWLPRACRADRLDLLHATFNYGLPVLPPGCPRVLTLHDAIEHVYYRQRIGWRTLATRSAVLSDLFQRSSRQVADHVITVSQHARRDLLRVFRLRPDRVTVTPEAADPGFAAPLPAATEAVRSRLGLPARYFLYVGGWEGRKNVGFLLTAFAVARVPGVDLVLAGGTDALRTEFRARAEAAGVIDRVHLLGWLADSDLPAVYAGAEAFVYPSEYEGFGLQLCEAMACGCPVLAARATSLPEVVGPGGELFGLEHPGELAGQLARVASDPAYRSNLCRRAADRARVFSWTACAAGTVAVYRRIVARGRQ